MQRRPNVLWKRWVLALVLLVMAGGCRFLDETSAIPTAVQQAQSPGATATAAAMPPTWTPAATVTPEDAGPLPTVAPRPTRTPGVFPSETPLPSPTTQSSATATTTASATPRPTETATSPPTIGGNLLPNPSFEEGWYHIDGIPELQVANQWQLSWEAGPNPLDEDPAPWVRPEARVLPPDFLPADEHDLFIWDGRQTVKIFKRQGAISFRLTTRVTLQPGTYLLEIFVFPDLVDEYEGDQKVWAPDPLSGEVRLIAGPWSTDWMLPAFGQKNRYAHTFHLDAAQDVEVGAAMRGRWAILNNGWFMDDWRLVRIAD